MPHRQTNKLQRICQKLELKPEDHLLEIGSGWGSLAIHAAQQHGCRVTTTTLSAAQHAHTLQRVKALGLEQRITVLHEDYRDLRGRFDYVSVSGPTGTGIARLAVLVLSERHGAVIREVAPPQQ